MVDVTDGEAGDAGDVGGLLALAVEHDRYRKGRHDGVLHLLVRLFAGDGLGEVTIEFGLALDTLVALDPPQDGVESHGFALVGLQVLEDTEFQIVHRLLPLRTFSLR